MTDLAAMHTASLKNKESYGKQLSGATALAKQELFRLNREQGEENPSFSDLHKEGEESKFSEELKEEMGEIIRAALLTPPPPVSMTPHLAKEISSDMKLQATASVLFTTMVGMVHHTMDLGHQKTTFLLDQPQFASSPFFGMEVVIEEFSTAPRIFNIQLIAGVQAARVLEQHLPALVSSFHDNVTKNRFSVHRLTSAHQSQRRSSFPIVEAAELLRDDDSSIF